MEELKNRAFYGRMLYRGGAISQKEAQGMIMPWIDAANEKSRELAKKYNLRPRLINFAAFVR